jgi:hypothetical protein
MCISNIGNRRPSAAARQARQQEDVSFLDTRMGLKEEFQKQQQVEADMTNKHHITVQHDYHDHSNDARMDYKEDLPARGGVTIPFPLRLHDMLETIAADGYDHVVSWQPHGRCIVVHKPKEFVELLPTYFKLSKLASFQRQLNLYGFQRLTKGRDRGGYYHELFLQGKVFLAHSIQRIKVKGTGVRARSNPDQEPDFWAMPWVVNHTYSTSGNDQAQSEPNEESTSMRSQSFVVDEAIAQLPLRLTPPVPKSIESMMFTSPPTTSVTELPVFDNKMFHYLDPFEPSNGNWTLSGVDELLASEADSFFEDFDFPNDIGEEIEDDDVFGDMLEQMIA